MSYEDHLSAFIAKMTTQGCEPKNHADILADDERHLIILAGDAANRKRLYYRFAIQGDFSLGWFKDCRTGETHNFHHKVGNSVLSREESSVLKKAREEAKELEKQERERRHLIFSARIKRAFQKMPLATSHPYLDKKSIQPHGARMRIKGNELIIPMYGSDGTLNGLQRIKENWKGYFKGSKSQASYFPLAKGGEDLSLLIITEGFATAATVREATALPVIVAFDSGNLQHVAKALKVKSPAAKLVFAADADQWGFDPKKRPKDIKTSDIPGDDGRWAEWRAAGIMYNVGLDKAKQAAAAIGGALVLSPPFGGAETHKPTDMNDYAAIFGLDAVKNLFTEALSRPAMSSASAEAPHGIQEGSPIPSTDVQAVGESYSGAGQSYPDYNQDYAENEKSTHQGDFRGMNFKVLGYNAGTYYYFPFRARQIISLTPGGHSMNNLLQLDSHESWQHRFGSGDTGPAKLALNATNAMVNLAHDRGVFQQEDRVRGAGTWLDDGRVILHCGDNLYVEGERNNFSEINSHYTYVAAAKLMDLASVPLKNAEANKLRQICEMVTWENKLSGSLLAGWLVVAPICAALQYRPHIYLTGESQAGKSTILNKIIKPVLGKFALSVGGKTTEPSVRQQMGYDARPLIFDEAEPSPTMSSVIDLARMASTGEIVRKFGQNPFNARFCACFSAIQPPINKTSDENRGSLMVVKKNRKATALQDYDDLLKMIEETITCDFGARLVRRTIDNIDSLFNNIDIFQRAFRKQFGDARASQQIGTMLAGLYLLSKTDVITAQAAEEWVKSYQWNDHTIMDQESDPLRLVQYIASCLIRTTGGREESIGELINESLRETDGRADKILRNYGIAVKDGRVYIANRTQNLERMLRSTEWNTKWGRTLSDVDGALKEKIVYFAAGIRTSAVSLPLSLFKQDDLPLFSQDAEVPETVPDDGRWDNDSEELVF